MDLYEALKIINLNKNYTEEELKKSYRKLIVKYHPDKHPESKKEFAEKQTKNNQRSKRYIRKKSKK